MILLNNKRYWQVEYSSRNIEKSLITKYSKKRDTEKLAIRKLTTQYYASIRHCNHRIIELMVNFYISLIFYDTIR